MTLSPSRKVIIIIIIKKKKKLPAWPLPAEDLSQICHICSEHERPGCSLAGPYITGPVMGFCRTSDTAQKSSCWMALGSLTQEAVAGVQGPQSILPETDILSCCPAAAPGESQRGVNCCHRDERPPSSDLSTTKLLRCHTVFYVNTYFIFQNWKRYKYIVPWIPDALGNLATKYATSPTTEYYHALHSTNKQAAQISLADDLG